MTADPPLLGAENLTKHYPVTEGFLRRKVGRVRAVDGVSFELRRGEALGLVGESGCGKSTLARTLLRLEAPTSGTVRFEGTDVAEFDRAELRRFRRRAQVVFQDPDGSLDPRMSVGESVAEPLAVQGVRDRQTRRSVAADLLERVGLSAADAERYPRELSGGQKQRVSLARALSVNPDLLVADEPTASLDASVRAEILSLLERLRAELGLSLLLVSHDLSVVRRTCDRVTVMYLGELVETGSTEDLFDDPRHPYTRALLGSIPPADPRRRGEMVGLGGDVPDPADPPKGCRFHTRCPAVIPPERYGFEGGAWRAVMDLRTRLRDGEVDVASLREFAAEEADVDPADVDDARVAAAVRAEFGVPERLSDPAAERVLVEALTALVGGEAGDARALLATEFGTVCEREAPALRPVDDGGAETASGRRGASGGRREAACHLCDGQGGTDGRTGDGTAGTPGTDGNEPR